MASSGTNASMGRSSGIRMQQGIKGGFPTPPQDSAIDVYKLMP
jgi:hypothetical protein